MVTGLYLFQTSHVELLVIVKSALLKVSLMEILSIVQSMLQGNRLACRDAWQEATQPVAAQTMIRR